ncbi:recombinase family protein [uncultured Aquimarina sp.]|uniref:recombinase family protein n=1 Tax=uncultured Aquimarina sp. TaxID=575652 RepID=UPI00260DE8A2|nr:recombinase family protein [uncultured Aquimarina sp.]
MEVIKETIRNKNIENNQKGKLQAVAYIRSAAKEQGTTVDHFVKEQRELCERFANKKEMTIVDFIVDIPKSGISNFQNDFIERIQAIKDQTNISYLIVASFNRLSRNSIILKRCIDELKQRDIEIVSVTEDIPKTNFLKYNNTHR